MFILHNNGNEVPDIKFIYFIIIPLHRDMLLLIPFPPSYCRYHSNPCYIYCMLICSALLQQVYKAMLTMAAPSSWLPWHAPTRWSCGQHACSSYSFILWGRHAIRYIFLMLLIDNCCKFIDAAPTICCLDKWVRGQGMKVLLFSAHCLWRSCWSGV